MTIRYGLKGELHFFPYFGEKNESEDKFVDGTYQSDENLLNNISTLNKHGA